MSWSPCTFGKYKGKTLPQIIFKDSDWFFWAIEDCAFKGRGLLEFEAADIAKKARRIRIPNTKSNPLVAEYVIHPPTGKFLTMNIVPAAQPDYGGSTFRLGVIDLSVPSRIASYDKQGCEDMIRSLKHAVFGNESARMTKRRCESFFDDDANFVI